MLPPAGAAAPKVTLCVPLNCQVTVPPTGIVATAGAKLFPGVVTVTLEAVGTDTVTVAVAAWVTPPLVTEAVIVAVPGATPVTKPVGFTVAVAAALVVKAGAGRPVIVAPNWSLGTAANGTVPPTEMAGLAGLTDTDVNAAGWVPWTTTWPVIPL